MTRLLDEAAIRSYRDAGFHTPLRVFSAGKALEIRNALEAVEAEHGPVFTENRAHAGAAFQGSYRYKSHHGISTRSQTRSARCTTGAPRSEERRGRRVASSPHGGSSPWSG